MAESGFQKPKTRMFYAFRGFQSSCFGAAEKPKRFEADELGSPGTARVIHANETVLHSMHNYQLDLP